MSLSIAEPPRPCPICGSTNVRWRRRRPYDFVLTYLRYFIDTGLGWLFRSTRTTVPGGIYSDRGTDAWKDGLEYTKARAVYEERVGTMTARWFWKCRECRRTGQVFEDVEAALDDRERLLELESQIRDNVATVNDPLGPEKTEPE